MSTTSSSKSKNAFSGLLLLAALGLIALVYWPGLTGGFVFDDYSNLVMNAPLHVTGLHWNEWVAAAFSSPSTDLQRPLAMLSFAVNHYFTGLDPWSMKLTNLLIHLLNTCLAFGLGRSILRLVTPTSSPEFTDRLALFASLCWALMPINLMAVLLVVQRMESLSHTFVFAGLWLYVAGRSRLLGGKRGWALILTGLVFFTGLGTLSKESAVLLPLYAFFLELLVFKFRRGDKRTDRGLIVFFISVLVIPAFLGVAWLLPQSLEPGPWIHRNFNLAERLMTEPRVVLDYLRWTLLPDLGQMGLFHDDYPVSRSLWNPRETLAGLVLVPLLMAAVWRLRRTRLLTSLGLSWFLAAQVLTATFLPLELVFEHRNYFASFGVCLVLVDLLVLAPKPGSQRQIGMIAAVLLTVVYATFTHLRVIEWSNPIRFAQSEARKHPNSPRATYNLGQMYAILSDGKVGSPFTAAAFDAFERASRVPNASIAPSQGALLLASRTGTPYKAEWWQDIQDRLRKQPIGPQELAALGSLTDCALSRRCQFPPDEMIGAFAAALSRGDDPELLNVYGNYALNVLRDEALAERLWKEAARLRPREPQYVISLAKLAISLGRRDEARSYIRHLRGMGRLGQFESAADDLEARLRAAPTPPGSET